MPSRRRQDRPASGTGANRHAYWFLRGRVSIDVIEAANGRIASAIDADVCGDPARILRPPSLNHKHSPPEPARLVHCDPTARHGVEDIVDVHGACALMTRTDEGQQPSRHGDDALLQIEPRHYVEQLTGLRVGRNGKIACPFHADDTPSLHAYSDPARGWYCYGCRRGGSIYDFGAALGGRGTRGQDFVRLRDELLDALEGSHSVTGTRFCRQKRGVELIRRRIVGHAR